MGSKTIRNKKVNKNQQSVASSAPVLISPQIWLPQVWAYRVIGNLFILVFISVLAFTIFTIKSNLIGKQLGSLSTQFYAFSNTLGFHLDDIIIRGRHHTSKSDIINVLNLNRENNILQLDLSELKEKIETLPWISSASLRRNYFPNVLQIDVQEKTVKSIWQFENNFYPIDGDGNIIDTEYIPTSPLLLIIGAKAPENITKLMPIIQHEKEIFDRIKVANFISKRRWDIILDDIENGTTIKLPEDNPKDAWLNFLYLNKTRGLLKRKLTIIDLRLKNKVIVQLHKSELDNIQQLKDIKEHKI